MKHMKKSVSIFMAAAMVLSLSTTAFAYDKQKTAENVGYEGNTSTSYVNVSNVISEQTNDSTLILTVASPAKVTFYGTKSQSISKEEIIYLPDSTYSSDGKITFGDTRVATIFDVQNESTDSDGLLHYESGNYVTLSNAGIYEVNVGYSGFFNEFYGFWVDQFYIVVLPMATPTTSTVVVNDMLFSFDAYTINGNNYFKLRDIATVLNFTSKQFEVTWDNINKLINLVSGAAYTAVGGELLAGDGTSKTATPNISAIYKDGAEVSLTAYTINGNNYFKLRDLGQALDFGVSWDGTTNTISIDTTTGYSE